MDLLNEEVRHKSFGTGQVIEQVDSYIEVSFGGDNKRFVYPDAFGSFLTIVDQDVRKKLDAIISKIEQKRQKEEAQLAKERAIEEERLERLRERERLMRNHKLHPAAQVAFWLDETEQSEVFSTWEVFTGEIKSGDQQGKPNKLPRVHQNSCCLITAREPDEQEENRRIVGLFMVREGFIGRLCEDGLYPAHSKFRLQLNPKLSEQMLFWNYYLNERYPKNMTWNSGRHRYFDNVWLAQILQDILHLQETEEDKKFVAEFLEYFLQLNHLDKEIPEAAGALKQK